MKGRIWIFHGVFDMHASYYADEDRASMVVYEGNVYVTKADAPQAFFCGIVPTDPKYWAKFIPEQQDGINDQAMNARQFFEKVREMRAAQNTYFKTKNYNDLNRARALEKEIDAEIKRVDAVVAERSAGPSLFDQDNQ